MFVGKVDAERFDHLQELGYPAEVSNMAVIATRGQAIEFTVEWCLQKTTDLENALEAGKRSHDAQHERKEQARQDGDRKNQSRDPCEMNSQRNAPELGTVKFVHEKGWGFITPHNAKGNELWLELSSFNFINDFVLFRFHFTSIERRSRNGNPTVGPTLREFRYPVQRPIVRRFLCFRSRSIF